jgi:flagellar biosynthetic protein FliR
VIDLTPVMRFALLLVRPGALIVFAPAFGGTYAPAQAKIGLTVLIAFGLMPTTPMPTVGEALPLAMVVAREVALGFALALGIRVMVAGAELGGHLAGFQMGLSYGATIDPQSGVRNPLLATLYGNLALVTFFMIGGHHAFLRALHQSYVDLPVGAGGIDASLPQTVADMLAVVFVLGARLAAPVVVVLVVGEIAMALMARAAPALNLMAVGAPARLLIGLAILPLVVPAVVGLISGASGSIVQVALRAAGAFR